MNFKAFCGILMSVKYALVAQLDRALPSDGRCRRFESVQARQIKSTLEGVFYLAGLYSKQNRRVRRSSRKGAITFADCEVSSKAQISGTARSGRKNADAEYPFKHTISLIMGICRDFYSKNNFLHFFKKTS